MLLINMRQRYQTDIEILMRNALEKKERCSLSQSMKDPI
jgi:hypothetical protein